MMSGSLQVAITFEEKCVALAQLIECADLEKDAHFVATITLCDGLFSDGQIADEFGVSLFTLVRWRHGQSLPQLYARKSIQTRICSVLRAKASFQI